MLNYPSTLSPEGSQRMESMEAAYLAERKAEATIYAFREIGRFLSGVPGRKNLIWLSGSFPPGIFPANGPLDAFAGATFYTSEMKKVTTELVLSQIAIDPVDVRGLTPTPGFSAAHPRSYHGPREAGASDRQYLQNLAGEQEMMEQIASDSAGRAFYNTNGLEEAIAAAVNQGTHYYTLSYSPTNKNFNGAARRISVTLGKSGLHLAYRRAYIAGEKDTAERGDTQQALDRMEAVMQRGAPTEHEILFKLKVDPSGDPVQASKDQLDEMKKLGAFASGKHPEDVKLQRYVLRFAILGKQLTLPAAGRPAHSLRVEVAADAFDADSQAIDDERWLAARTIPQEEFEEMQRDACRLSQTLDVPAGARCLRVAVKDVASRRIGSLEIPLPISRQAISQTERQAAPAGAPPPAAQSTRTPD